jgi:hypothetical protein
MQPAINVWELPDLAVARPSVSLELQFRDEHSTGNSRELSGVWVPQRLERVVPHIYTQVSNPARLLKK